MLKLMKTGLATAIFAAVAATAAPVHAGVMSVTDKASIGPGSLTDQVYWRGYHPRHMSGWRHGWRNYGWRSGSRYGWNWGWYPYRNYGFGYGYGYPYYGAYGLAGAATAPLVTDQSVVADGNYCATSVKTCLLYEPGWLGTGCSCKVPDGRARGMVVQ